MRESSKREHLIDTALGLFSKNGYHATGIDLILSEAGVAKKTLYKHFESKEELIVEVLKKYDNQFRSMVQTEVFRIGTTPDERLLAIFDVAHDWFKDKHFYGCMFINAIGEYSDSDTTIRDVCKGFKQSMHIFILKLCEEGNFKQPEELADEIAMLLEGSIVTAQVSQKPHAAQIAKRTTQLLLKSHKSRRKMVKE